MTLEPNGQQIFNLTFALTFTEMALQAALMRLSKLSGPEAEAAITELEQACVKGIKNATPTDPGVPDEIMQQGVAFSLERIKQPFAKVRRDLSIG